jgi:MinD-like ATPase involved in chromosome partitioning or flagellar assembly
VINEALVVEGQSNRAIAGQYGLGRESVRRHRAHIPELLLKARDDLEGYEMDTILRKIEDLERETLEQLEGAKEEDEDRRVVLAAIREQRQNIELLAKVAQLIDQAPKVNMVLIAPQVQQVIIQALAPYPQARLAVADALGELEAAHDGS